MKKIAWSLIAAGCLVLTLPAKSSNAQTAVLADMYGRGVHAYYSGMMDESLQYFTMAIDNSIEDPRAYYFRGMVYNSTGRPEEAEADWKTGAEMEAAGRVKASIGKSLARLQGSARLKLESIRQKAKLEALATAMKRSKERYGELNAAGQAAAPVAPAAPIPVPPTGAGTVPVPPTGAPNPFADDMAQGQPEVVEDDALKNAMNDPFAGEAPAGTGTATPPANNPFGGNAGGGADPFGGNAGGGADPFGGNAGGGADPFGGGGAGGGADPFGGGGAGGGADPFGGGGAGGGADPFGGAGGGADPFGGN